MANMTFGHKYGPTCTEVWIRPGRVELSMWEDTTLTLMLTPEQADQLAEVLTYAAKEAKQ